MEYGIKNLEIYIYIYIYIYIFIYLYYTRNKDKKYGEKNDAIEDDGRIVKNRKIR